MASTAPRITRRAYAKINLGLRVTGKRPDGYHDISTVFHRIEPFDDVTLVGSEEITVRTTDPDVPSGESNICHAAAVMVREKLGGEGGVRIDITKRIPVGAGLGGGSADAAAVLLSLPLLWGKTLPGAVLSELALRLGSDVPYFLGDGTATGGGRGELLEYFHLDLPFAVLLCAPPLQVQTRWAYAQIVPRPLEGEDLRSLLLRGLEDPAALRSGLVNDFETPVFREHPVIRSVKESMIRAGAVFASLSGSGSSVYGFFGDAHGAGEASRAPEMRRCRTFITPPHFRV